MPPAVDEHDAGTELSDLSSLPSSPPQIPSDEIAVARRTPHLGEGVVANPTAANSAPAASAQTAPSHTAPSQDAPAAAPAKAKRQRKPKEIKPDSKDGDKPVKKARKPRETKIKKEGEASSAPAPRKRQKIEGKVTPMPAADAPAAAAAPVSRQATLTEMVNHFHPPGQPASAPHQHIQPQPQPQPQPNPQPLLSQPTHSQPMQYQPPVAPSSQPQPLRPQQSNSSDHLMRSSLPPHASTTPTPRPYSSGQNYDPIRGSTIDSAPPPPSRTSTLTANGGAHSAQASPRINRASASPSIISLIDPPEPTKTSVSTMPYAPQTATLQHQAPPPTFVATQQTPPTPPRAATLSAPPMPASVLPSQQSSLPTTEGAMELDQPAGVKAPDIKIQSKSSSSAAPTTKPAPAKHSEPLKATGTGLLASSDLFGSSSNQSSERKGIDIEIRISLDPAGSNTLNMAQEIVKKYGRDAINPRAAAHREHLLQIAAAQNKFDGGSADDMSVDLMSELGDDSNVEMGGMDDEKSVNGADDPKPRKRRKKVEDYDKEDDFIDDTELAWQEQAAVAKDGFFVYSGPLIPKGQTAQVESSTTGRSRGGGRGRGRGRAAAAAANAVTHSSLAEKNKEASAPASGRGRGRGRGTGTTRKPRITKADRERLEQQEREKAAASSAAGSIPLLAPSTATTNINTTTAQAMGVPDGPLAAHARPSNHLYGQKPSGVPV